MEARRNSSSSSSSSNNRHLPWFSVIEALADSKLVDSSLLNDLISRASELTDESFAQKARERLALNQLEDFITKSELPTNNNENLTIDQPERIEIDVSEPAHDLLNRLLPNKETSSARKPISESLKNDISQYVLHKRAHFPKCDLKQLKSAILEGVHPSASYLMKISGLDKSGLDNPPDSSKKKASCSGNEQVQCLRRGASCRLCGCRISSGDKEVSDLPGDVNSLNDGDDDDEDEDDGSKFILQRDDGNEYDGLKKLNQGTNGGEVQNNESQIPSSKFILQRNDGNEFDGLKRLNQGTNGGEVQNNESQIPSSNFILQRNDGNEFDGLKRLSQGTNGGEVQNNESQIPSRNIEIPQGHSNGYYQEDKNVNDGNLDKAPSSDSDVEAVIAAKKHNNLSSESTFNRDTQDMSEWTEGNLCIKCNKDGQLLTCCGSTCMLSFHESCIGSSISISDSGDIYCPSCLYAKAVTEYREIKKKVVQVKKKVKLTRSHLSEFMSMVNAQRQQLSEIAAKEDLLNSRTVRDTPEANFPNENDDRLQRERNDNEPMQVPNVLLDCNKPKSPVSDRNIGKAGEEDIHEQDIVQNQREVEGQELAESHTTHHSDDLPKRVEETSLSCKKTSDVLLGEKRTGTDLSEDPPSVLEEKNHLNARRKRKTAKSPGTNVKTADAHKKHDDVEKEIEDWQYTSDRPQTPSCQANMNENEVPENRNGDGISLRLRKRETLPTIHTNSPRRKKTVWSAEEEEILKEGVCTFTGKNDRNIPWKRILEFGSHVFKKSRTPIDLKDKWRNISSKEEEN